MRYAIAITVLSMLAWLPAGGQQITTAIDPTGAGFTAPILLPSTMTISKTNHCDELNGIVKFSATVDALGLPHILKTMETSDWRLVDFATELVEAQRFKPAIINGSATAVSIELTVGLHTCAQHQQHSTGNNFYRFTLRAHPMIGLAVTTPLAVQEPVSETHTEIVPAEQVGKHISAPISTILTEPKVPISGKLLKRGQCFVGITVDANGVPQNIHVVRGLEPELDSNTLEAVKSWRFKPALRDGNTPVAFEGTVMATFEYIEKEPVAFAHFIPETPEEILAAQTNGRKQHCTLEPINADEVLARYMPQSRIAGRILVSLIVDTKGVPQNVHIIKGMDSSLDMDMVAMVEHLRFKPVMKDATTPVPFGVVMPVRYRMARVKPTWRDIFVDSLSLITAFM